MTLYKILIINPNTTASMTDALMPIVEGLDYNNVKILFPSLPSIFAPLGRDAPQALKPSDFAPGEHDIIVGTVICILRIGRGATPLLSLPSFPLPREDNEGLLENR